MIGLVPIWSGSFPSKGEWKRMTYEAVSDHEFPRWRLQLRLFRKLSDFRVVQLQITPSVWWTVARYNVKIKSACCTMLKLLCGCNKLRVNMDTDMEYAGRVCTICNNGQIEDVAHMVMDCAHYVDIRNTMYEKLQSCLQQEAERILLSLPVRIRFYILMGLDYPPLLDSVWDIRYFACQGIKRMYDRRCAV